MNHYRASCKITFTVPSDWVLAPNEFVAAEKIMRLMTDQAAALLGIRRELIDVVVGKAEEWVTYEPSPQRPPVDVHPPAPLKRPRAAPDPAKRHRAPFHRRRPPQ